MMMTFLRSSVPEVSLRKGVLKICCKFTGEHPCRNVISIKLQSSFIEIALRHGCSPVNLLHLFRTTFPRSTSGWLLLCHLLIHLELGKHFVSGVPYFWGFYHLSMSHFINPAIIPFKKWGLLNTLRNILLSV